MSKHPFKKKVGVIDVIENWNIKFPFDFHWRRKYNIPFGSPQHRQMCLFDIKFDMSEGKYIDYLISVNKYGEEDSNQLLKKRVTDESNSDKIRQEFDDLNLEDF